MLGVPACDASVATAQAQSGSVNAVFEKHNLLGTFARDCSQPASPDNWYFVNRLSGANQVQRDYMVGPTERQSVAMIDTAVETGRNQITSGGRFTGKSGGKSYNNQPMIGILAPAGRSNADLGNELGQPENHCCRQSVGQR
jgi:hypothetical protein